MTKLAFVFPGQGSQSVGMSDALAQSFPVVRETYQQASDALGYDLAKVVAEGPEERLNQTAVTQPALLTAAIAVLRVWRGQGGEEPALAAGHSLGEYSALVCADSLDFGVAVALVAERGRLMQEAVAEGQGAMAAILGLDDEQVRQICAQAVDGGVVEAVNYNAPGQVVIAGDRGAVERARAAAQEAGAKRVVPLAVSVPSHCALMRPAAERLAEYLKDVAIEPPRIPVLHNCDVADYSEPDSIRDALARQLYNPVRWVETIQAMAQAGAEKIIECGPGKVLIGLNKRIDRKLSSQAVFDPASLEQALS